MKIENGFSAMTDGLVARIGLAIVFLYHGLVPKILFLSETEILMIKAHGAQLPIEKIALAAGIMEIFIGLAILLFPRSAWPVRIALASLIVLLLDVAIFSPALLIQAFNPVSTNIGAIALCIIALNRRDHAESDRK